MFFFGLTYAALDEPQQKIICDVFWDFTTFHRVGRENYSFLLLCLGALIQIMGLKIFIIIQSRNTPFSLYGYITTIPPFVAPFVTICKFIICRPIVDVTLPHKFSSSCLPFCLLSLTHLISSHLLLLLS